MNNRLLITLLLFTTISLQAVEPTTSPVEEESKEPYAYEISISPWPPYVRGAYDYESSEDEALKPDSHGVRPIIDLALREAIMSGQIKARSTTYRAVSALFEQEKEEKKGTKKVRKQLALRLKKQRLGSA
ncbi:hypothetical protein JST99_01420 [Candidatus Dependentiae bacterium]|nr:hypothetical protein [Candidatus Dependentiae bacterium]MCC7415226.1 hypothetical protein [Campylobacterota bacterium]